MKKIISILLSVLMVLSVMPMTVFAADEIASVGTTSTSPKYATLQEAIDAAVESGVSKTVKLLANTTEDIVIPNTNGKTITLKTNGKTITGVSSSAITVQSGAILVMNDTGSVVTTVSGKEAISNEFGGKITLGTSSYAPKISRADGTTGYVIKNQGTMIIENATVTNGNANDTSALVANGWYNNDEAVDTVNLTIKKGTYTSTKGITVKNDAKGILNISGGTFTHGNNSDNVQNWNIANISGGTFNNRIRTIKAKDDTSIGQTTITGGVYNGEIVVLEYYPGYVGTTAISAGTFATKPNEDFIVAENYWYYQTTAGKYVMTTATPTVECNGNQYPSMSIALAQNNYEGEYTLIADSPSFVLPASTDKTDKEITLNLNGYSVKESGSGSAIKINGTNAKVTINGPGNVYAGKNSSTANTSVASAVWVTKVADVTINGGNYYAYTNTAGKANPVVYNDAIGTTITINDGNFVGADAATKDSLIKVRPSYAGQADYEVNGGTFSADISKLSDVKLAEDFKAVENADGTFTVQLSLDYTAFDAAVVTANAVNEIAYEEAGITALKALVASYDKADFTSQAEVDAAAADIQTAVNALETKSFNVVAYVDGIETLLDTTYAYGTEVYVGLPAEYDGYNVLKWTVEKDGKTTVIPTNDSVISIVINADTEIIAYVQERLTEANVEEGRLLRKYTFLSKAGAVVGIGYAYTDDLGTLAMPEAPAVPFYTFARWDMIDERTFVATYTVTPEKMCQVNAGDGVLVNGKKGVNVQYDSLVKVTTSAPGKLALARDAEGADIITYLNSTTFHCPMTSQVYVVLVQETAATIGVTGTYYANSTLGTNAQYYLPAGASLIECGVIYTANGRDVKLKSTKQTDKNEFTVELRGNFGALASVDTRAYITYSLDGNVKTVESSAVTIIL